MGKKLDKLKNKLRGRKLCWACEHGSHSLCVRKMDKCECLCWRL